MAVKCNITTLILHRLTALYWGVREKNITPAILENYIESLGCDTDIDGCYGTIDNCEKVFIRYDCKFRILGISFEVSNDPNYDVTFYLSQDNFINGIEPLSLIWTYNQNHFDLFGNVTDTKLRLKLKPGKTLNSLSSKISISVVSSDGCISGKQCYFVNGVMQCNPNYLPCYGPGNLVVQKNIDDTGTLSWSNQDAVDEPNVLNIVAAYREKKVNGTYSTDGFLPANPQAKGDTTTTLVASYKKNVVYEVILYSVCGQNGPIYNDNGAIEIVDFECLSILPTTNKTETTASISYNLSSAGLDIEEMRMVLKKTSDSSTVSDQVVLPIAGVFSSNVSGLTPGTEYRWEIVYYITVNGQKVSSADANQLSVPCILSPFSTDILLCNPVSGLTVGVSP